MNTTAVLRQILLTTELTITVVKPMRPSYELDGVEHYVQLPHTDATIRVPDDKRPASSLAWMGGGVPNYHCLKD